MDFFLIVSAVVLSVLLPLGAYRLGRRAGFQGDNEQAAQLREESRQLEAKLVETLADAQSAASKSQVEFLRKQCESYRAMVAEQQQAFVALAERIEQVRTEVQTKEEAQRELRVMDQEDQAAISETITVYNECSTESVALEQRLAESLRTLDSMASEVKMTSGQQAIFAELSNALTQASAQLRDVIIDYQTAHERLTALSSRFSDLEAEYSKLIEQQLAG